MSPRAIRFMEVLHVPVPESAVRVRDMEPGPPEVDAAEAVPAPAVPVEAARPVVRSHRRISIAVGLAGLATLLAVTALILVEIDDFRLQAGLLSRAAERATFAQGPGPSDALRFPSGGPYDVRLGYARMPAILARLQEKGAPVLSQARWSQGLREVVEAGLFPSYREKDQAGLRLRDRAGRLLYQSEWPRRAWATFDDIPPIVVDVLRFIENRDLLDPGRPFRNPALEWDRLAHAAGTAAMRSLGVTERVFGGSTLATQVEKFRHSPGGRTRTARDKWRQMESAALRAYREGPVTLEAQRRTTLAYLDTLPLGAVPGYGEVLGVPDGLWAWFGRDFDQADRLLRQAAKERSVSTDGGEAAKVFREVLALLLAQRRPAWYRGEGRAALERLVDAYTRVLSRDGVISRALRDRVLEERLSFTVGILPDDPVVPGDRKGVDAVRASLLGLLGIDSLHDLDRLDLDVVATLDAGLQGAVARMFRSLADPATVKRLKLRPGNLLGAGDPAALLYSFVLYERDGEASVLRAQTDEFDGPFSLNDQMKLELGSTAKLRTLVSYLEVIGEIRDRALRGGADWIEAARTGGRDPLTRFVAGWLFHNPGGDLAALLQAALDRRYPGSPKEKFRTGGGVHKFANFHRSDDLQTPSVREAFHESVNLAFVRILRDVIAYLVESGPYPASRVLKDESDPRRAPLLARFADEEGTVFQAEAWNRYRGLDSEAAAARLLDRVPSQARRIAAAFRAIRPEAGPGELAAALHGRVSGRVPAGKSLDDLHAASGPPRLAGLQDHGFVARIHPLELATVAWRLEHPEGSFAELVRDTAASRQDAYRWLFRSTRKAAQERRMRDVIEREAFERLHERWVRVGYPFPALVPSLATAIGSSGDQPRALAELAGIVQAGGIRHPLVRVDRLRFGRGTPYDTEVGRPGSGGVRVMRPEVAEAVRTEMVGVVDRGTARRVKDAFNLPRGAPFVVGGKTGTGDNRREVHGPRGQVLATNVTSRTGTFVFFVGDRWFGALTAHVPGPAAARYRFTSALPVEVLRLLAPSILASATAPDAPRPALAEEDSGSIGLASWTGEGKDVCLQ